MPYRIEAVIFDWAGTAVDYGCFAPMHAFIEAFKRADIEVTHEEVRKPMGLLKKDHIRELLKMERIKELWIGKYGELPNEQNIDELYRSFEELLMDSLHLFTTPIPGVLETVAELRKRKLKIGSTTGFTKEMMEVVAEGAKKQGYSPDYLVCSDEVPNGRPYPYMIQKNMVALNLTEANRIIKVGDTISDIQEGQNAGTWTVAVLIGSSELGLSESGLKGMDATDLAGLKQQLTLKFKGAGADYVIDSMKDLPAVIDRIDTVLRKDQVNEPIL